MAQRSAVPRRAPLRVAAAAVAAALLVAAAPARAGGVLTVCTEASPDGFDVAQSTSTVTSDAAGLAIYDQLLRFKPGTAELAPGLVERWETGADGRQLTLFLRRGVQFHATPWFTPTREMNADDVVFSLQRQHDPKSPWRAAARTGFISWGARNLDQTVKAIEKLDANTVRLTLNHADAALPNHLANAFVGSVFSAEYAARLMAAGRPGDLDSKPVGTGPFVFRSYQKDAVIRYGPHKGYWAGPTSLDGLVIAITHDPQVRVQRLKAGECLIGANMRAETVPSFEGTKVKAIGGTTLISGFVPLNTEKPFLNDKRFRQALWMGFDKASFIQSVYGGRARPAASFLPPAQWSHDATLKDRFDPERAKSLVKASGYDGRELAIFTRIGGSIDGKRAAELMQADWARIGVKTRVQMMEWGELLKRTGLGEHDITFLNWAGSGDPDGVLTPNLSCAAIAARGNRSRWCHKEFDALLDAARSTPDRARRTELYVKAQRIIHEEVPLIPSVYPENFVAVHEKVRGFVPNPRADLDLRGVSLP